MPVRLANTSVEFHFEPASVKLGLLISLAALLLVAGGLVVAGGSARSGVQPQRRPCSKVPCCTWQIGYPVYRLIMRHDLLRGWRSGYVAGEDLADGTVVAQTLNTQTFW